MNDYTKHGSGRGDGDGGDDLPEDALDALLAEARWPEASADSTRRLVGRWRVLRRSRRVWRSVGGGLAAAAAIALAVGTGMWWTSSERGAARRVVERATAPAEPEQRRDEATDAGGRPANALEMLVLLTAEGRERERGAEWTDELTRRIDAAVMELIEYPKADAARIARPLLESGEADRLERRLIARIRNEGGPRRVAAARLLAEAATWRSGRFLLGLAEDPTLRAAVMNGLLRLSDAPALVWLAETEADPLARRRLLAELLQRDPAEAVPAYLRFVLDSRTSASAMAALERVGDPPINALFAQINSSHVRTRLAAARVLGRLADRPVVARLAGMVERGDHRREALAALVSCSEEAAGDVLAAAGRDPSLASLMRVMKSEMDQLFPEEPSHVDAS